MVKYTYEDIIIDPKSDRAKAAIKKECYFGDSPRELLNEIGTKKAYTGILTDLFSDCFVEDYEDEWSCIIVKKEEESESKYVPFENQKEFVRAHQKFKESIKHGTFESNLADCGIWLKNKQTKSCSMVIEIESKGVALGGNILSNDWQDLFEYHTFIDGTPCGKEVEE